METLELAYPRKKAEQIVTGLERPLNRHLIKLLALQATEETRAVWKKETKRWLREIAAIRLKPRHAPLKAKDLFEWLFEEPFGGVETANVRFILDDEGEDFARLSTAEEAAQRLRGLHETLSQRLSDGDPAIEMIDEL